MKFLWSKVPQSRSLFNYFVQQSAVYIKVKLNFLWIMKPFVKNNIQIYVAI